MKLKTIKTQAEIETAIGIAGDGLDRRIGLHSLQVELVTQDSSIKQIRIGNLVVKGDYGMSIAEVVQFEEADRYRVRLENDLVGDIEDFFEDMSDARERFNAIERMLTEEAAKKLTFDRVKARIDSAGTVASVVKIMSHIDGHEAGDLPF